MLNVNFIKLYNKFMRVDNEFHLSMNELFFYSLLKRRQDYSGVTVTSIDLIYDLMDQFHNIKFYSKKSESRNEIVNLLQSLQDKGLITVKGDTEKHNNLFEVSFTELKDEGFAQINFNTFDNITSISDLYIYFVVSCFNNINNDYKTTFDCSDERWSQILGVKAINTVRKYINQAIDNGLIHKNTGDYKNNQVRNGQNGQDVSQYKIIPFVEEEKSNMQRKKEREGTDHSITDINDEWGETNNKYPFDTGNWLNKNNLDVDDYVIYLKHKNNSNPISKDFIAKCDQKRNILDKNGKFKEFVEKKLIEQAKEEIKHQIRKQNELIEEQARQIINETDDIVVLVDGKLLPYAKWDKVSKVERVYYLFGKWVSQIDSYVYELYSEEVVDNEDVERFRPDKNGEWDNEEKQLKREMELDDFEDIDELDLS